MKKYEIRDNSGKLIFCCNDLIECHDFMGTSFNYLFAFIGVSEQDVNLIINEETYFLKSNQFDGRFDFDFTVQMIIKSDDVLYACLSISSGMYEIGALSFLKTQNDNEERVWLDMKGRLKLIYISASYLKKGFPRILNKDTIIIEGKYIQDYYAFFCEFGYALFGKFGYMGNNLGAVSDLLNDLWQEDRKINVIWEDSELSFKAIDNTVPEGYYQSSSIDIVMTIQEYCNIILK